MKAMRDMLYVTFSDKLHAAPADPGKGVNVGSLMKLVARNAKQGAQLTPQGVLRWPLSSAQAEDVIRETRDLLAGLDTADVPKRSQPSPLISRLGWQLLAGHWVLSLCALQHLFHARRNAPCNASQ